MTNDEKRIKIAEAWGWKRCCYPEFVGRGEKRHRHAMFSCNSNPLFWMHRPGWKGPKDYGPDSNPTEPPDYFNDLNACAEMEKALTDQQWGVYVNYLTQNAKCDYRRQCAQATASQRAEAFGKTLGLW